ncbi:UDP-N-acetylmuramoyl-tripeptide--D-alanyl-D-alanine ligase [Amphibacillus marinus]|uniref:UDP-N-acetylmuramoyl-tripeptide--D-alanyl-D-alanine ligase n=1 Tax=Amphibacillus marinus TaxID=872970 RepID=A0A1H8I588_9BACI|nr:UDP-N-acetylmuramoyl-tripeptide--D-alanyl-D-alanine ligase [Amphibacillus marinus]SEN63357.1 UDP-N-acetylmuramoyl-tripeptide--D-alanyl-D-alanine ligase [Amphibacillus marinus]
MLTIELLKSVFTNHADYGFEDLTITGVSTDTRELMTNKLFVPLVGERFNGHDYITTARKQGAVAALWQEDRPVPAELTDTFPLFYVEDTLIALQQLAESYLQRLAAKVIAITGSNGKTTTKDLVASVCRMHFQTHCTNGNLNNHIGVPLTILAAPSNTEVLILEMGMSGFGEIEYLSKLAKPDIAIITNIGESHIEHLGSRTGIAKAKLEIVDGLNENGLLIYDGDEALLNQVDQLEIIKVGFQAGNHYTIKNVEVCHDQTLFEVGDFSFTVPLVGAHHAKNATYSIVVGHHLNLTDMQIQLGLNSIEKTAMRFEQLKTSHGARLINDAYNASPTSMKGAIDVISQFNMYNKKILVLGDMLELGEQTKAFHEEIGKYIPDTVDFVCTLGEYAVNIHQQTAVPSKHFLTHDQVAEFLQSNQDPSTVILFKASRGMKFEQIINELIER